MIEADLPSKLFWSITLLFTVVPMSKGIISFQRWCYVSESSEWLQYNDSLSSCVKCGTTTKLFLDRSSQANEKCCNGKFSTSCNVCAGKALNCTNQNQYCSEHVCNGINDCGDGTDETNSMFQNCSKPLCLNGSFQCGTSDIPQCFISSRICDQTKICGDGFDETGCQYYEGVCLGYLCNTVPQCVNKSSVCDGVKDCIDGTDEKGCNPLHTSQQFYCNGLLRNGPTIDMSQVCDGTKQCSSGTDEVNCYTWTPWTAWSSCTCNGIQSSNPGQRNRSRNCVTYKDATTNVNGQCIGLSNESNCVCEEPTTFPITLIVIISLVSLIVVVGFFCIVYLCWNSNRKRNAKNNNNENLQPSPAVQAGSRLQPSPAVVSTRRPNSALSTQNSLFNKSPALSNYSQRSHLTAASVRVGPMSDDVAPLRASPYFALPLPARPASLFDDGYSSIKEVTSLEIDPYAETKHVKVKPRPESKFSMIRRTDSLDSFLNNPDGHSRNGPERQRTISRFPLEELGRAPTAPNFQRSRSMEALDGDGYLVPTMSQKIRMDRQGNYTTMSSPEKRALFRTTPTKPKGYTKVVKKKQGRQGHPIQGKNGLKKATSFSHNVNKHPRSGEISPSHSETYANMLKNNSDSFGSGDAKQKLMTYINELSPPLVSPPVISPPPFNPPKLEISACSPEKSPQNTSSDLGSAEKVLCGDFSHGSQYDSLFAPKNSHKSGDPQEDYGKLEKEEIDLT